MGMAGETLVYLEHLPQRHPPQAESKNQHLKSLLDERHYKQVVNVMKSE